MVTIEIEGDALVIQVQGVHKMWALKSSVRVPLTDIRDVQHDPERATRVMPGLRMPARTSPTSTPRARTTRPTSVPTSGPSATPTAPSSSSASRTPRTTNHRGGRGSRCDTGADPAGHRQPRRTAAGVARTVAPPASETARYTRLGVSTAQAGREMGVAAVLTGTVERRAESVIVRLELLRSALKQ